MKAITEDELRALIAAEIQEHIRLHHGKTTRFTKPCVEEVAAFAASLGKTINAHDFIDFYDSKGWVVGKSPMKDWKAAVRRWLRTSAPVAATKKIKLFPIPGRNCKCGMPAVYKTSVGGFDHYYCSDHMPESVKLRYE